MSAFLHTAVESFGSSLVQFALGFALALLVRRLSAFGGLGARLGLASGPAAWAAIPASALAGALLPLGPAGAVPLAAAALALGFGAELAIPFLCTNLFFDSLVPFADPTFIWRTGYLRFLFALIAGIIAGLLAHRARKAALLSFRSGALPSLGGALRREGEGVGFGAHARDALESLGIGAVFLAAGAVADAAFKRYVLAAIMAFAYTNPAASFVPGFFATRNVVNPFFLITMRIVAVLSDFSILAALALILKPRGFLRYFAYFAAWAVLLGLSAFFEV
jgi:uncharacterized membrane protein YraQ (UPF0718 family)